MFGGFSSSVELFQYLPIALQLGIDAAHIGIVFFVLLVVVIVSASIIAEFFIVATFYLSATVHAGLNRIHRQIFSILKRLQTQVNV